jgi:hypothetical protein
MSIRALALRVIVDGSHEIARVEGREFGGLVGWEAEPGQSLSATVRPWRDGVPAPRHGRGRWRRGPGAGGQHDERVEHIGVESGGIDQGIVSAFDRRAQLAAQ